MLHTDHRQPRPSLNKLPTGSVPNLSVSMNPMRSVPSGSVAVKRVTLTSKKNWWMVELEEDENKLDVSQPFPTSTEPTLSDFIPKLPPPPPNVPTSPLYNAPRNPAAIFSFPTPAIYSAPPNPTAVLTPFAQGSASELFKCIVKKPEVVQLEINGEMQSNALDVTTQFLAELRVYTHVAPHRNIPVFLGCLDGIGMLLDALTHMHAYGLSHGDISLLNIQVIERCGELTLKLLDFGRSVGANSVVVPPDGNPVDPWEHLNTDRPGSRMEQIYPGTRPFSAPEILRGECHDARLADAYSFGMVLVCLERGYLVDVKPWDQRKDLYPGDLLTGCILFRGRITQYLRRWDERRRLLREDMVDIANA
ncbi:kinase-like domain-containing protein [Lactifluus volemus]|nr:kinase-like domain-containing protein [Lactifluus volemus]